jgi:hypothetical protein
MTERLTLLITLELAIARGSIERRKGMLLKLADLFLRESIELTEDQVVLFDEVISRIAMEVDVSVRALLAQRFAPIANAPINSIRMLASDKEIKVAYPVLAHSDRIDEATIINSARTASQKHLLAISWRKSLSEALTDVLLDRGNRQVVLSIAKNRGARFSDMGFRIMVERSGDDDILAALLGSRPDMLSLFIRAPEVIKMKLVESSHVRHEIDRLVAFFVNQCQDHASGGLAIGGAQHSWQGRDAPLADAGVNAFVVAESAEENAEEDFEEDNSPLFRAETMTRSYPVKATNTEERRRRARQKSFLRGCIYFNNRGSSVECLIRDMSQYGARILISGSINIPDVVDLYIPQKGRTLRARVEWRQEEEIGLAFVEATIAAEENVTSQQIAQRLEHLESEITSMRGVIKRVKAKVRTGSDSDAA